MAKKLNMNSKKGGPVPPTSTPGLGFNVIKDFEISHKDIENIKGDLKGFSNDTSTNQQSTLEKRNKNEHEEVEANQFLKSQGKSKKSEKEDIKLEQKSLGKKQESLSKVKMSSNSTNSTEEKKTKSVGKEQIQKEVKSQKMEPAKIVQTPMIAKKKEAAPISSNLENTRSSTTEITEATLKRNLFEDTENKETTLINKNLPLIHTTTGTSKGETTIIDDKVNFSSNKKACSVNQSESEQYKTLIENVKKKAIQIIPFEKVTNSGELLGEGGFGVVFKGFWSGTEVAIKEMTISFDEFRVMDAEMTFMSKYRHPRLVGLYGICLQEVRANKLHCGMVMELMKMDLETLIAQKNGLDLKEKIRILREITEGVLFLHENGVIHRDLKPKNILLDNNNSAKITDLGIAKVLENKEKTENATMAFTARYASREAAIENITNFKADVWSLGLLFYEALTEKKAWGAITSTRILLQLNSRSSPFEKDWETLIPQELVACIQACVEYDLDKRITSKELLDRIKKFESSLLDKIPVKK